jgi:hypothetical protein
VISACGFPREEKLLELMSLEPGNIFRGLSRDDRVNIVDCILATQRKPRIVAALDEDQRRMVMVNPRGG